MDRFVKGKSGEPAPEVVLNTSDYTARLADLLKNNTLKSEIHAAYEYADKHVDQKALGLMVKARKADECKRLTTGGGSCVASCSLRALQLPADALMTLDAGKIANMLSEGKTVADLIRSVGTITVNASVWDGEAFTKLQRMNKDAEIQTLCLVLMWSESNQLKSAC